MDKATSFCNRKSGFDFPSFLLLRIFVIRNLDDVALFPGLKRSQKQFSYAAKQLIAREVSIYVVEILMICCILISCMMYRYVSLVIPKAFLCFLHQSSLLSSEISPLAE